MDLSIQSIFELSKIVGAVMSFVGLIGAVAIYWRAEITRAAIQHKETEAMQCELLQIQSETSQLKGQINSLKDSFSESLQQIFLALGRLEGSVNAQNSKAQ